MVAALGFDGQRVETLKHEVAVALLLALETAMRAGEILALRPADLDYRRRVAVLHRSKTGPGRDVPLSSRAIELLKIMGRRRLLHPRSTPDGRIWHATGDTLDATFRRARTAAGLDGFTFHDSRATALTRLSKVLQPLELARMSGHSNLNELLTYYREPVESIAARLG
jgi:integrase